MPLERLKTDNLTDDWDENENNNGYINKIQDK